MSNEEARNRLEWLYEEGHTLSAETKTALEIAITALEENKKLRATQQWIPVSERLPEDDVEVLISYRSRKDKNRTGIDTTTYGYVYFGGQRIGDAKEWRNPYRYFHESNEIVAWMPLPESYKEDENELD